MANYLNKYGVFSVISMFVNSTISYRNLKLFICFNWLVMEAVLLYRSQSNMIYGKRSSEMPINDRIVSAVSSSGGVLVSERGMS